LEEDELLQDAFVIVEARAEYLQKPTIFLKDISELFGGRKGPMLKTRRDNLLKRPGETAYVDLLRAAWEDVWSHARGTDALPDANPEGLTGFGLSDHIVYLRQHVNKSNLCVPCIILCPEFGIDFDFGQAISIFVAQPYFCPSARSPQGHQQSACALAQFSCDEGAFESGRLGRFSTRPSMGLRLGPRLQQKSAI
jgi:hypothetical protein